MEISRCTPLGALVQSRLCVWKRGSLERKQKSVAVASSGCTCLFMSMRAVALSVMPVEE